MIDTELSPLDIARKALRCLYIAIDASIVEDIEQKCEDVFEDFERMEWMERTGRGVEPMTGDDGYGERTKWCVDDATPDCLMPSCREAIDRAREKESRESEQTENDERTAHENAGSNPDDPFWRTEGRVLVKVDQCGAFRARAPHERCTLPNDHDGAHHIISSDDDWMTTQTRAIEATPISYFQRLAMRCEDWRAIHPEEYQEVLAACGAKLAVATEDSPFRTRGQEIVLNALVMEEIRRRAGWPTEDSFKRDSGHGAYK